MFIFELAGQHAKRRPVRDPEELSREIAMNAFEQLWRQPAARNKVCQSFKDGNEDWKRVAHMCVIHARAEAAKRALLERRRRAAVPVETLYAEVSGETCRDERISDLVHCFDALDNDRKLVLRLRFQLGLTFQEIAERLKWSKTRVYGCYSTAIMHLERLLKEKE